MADGAVTLADTVSWAVPRIAAAGDVRFVTGNSRGKIVLMSYTADLRPRWPKPMQIAPGWEAEIAADGRNAVVVWTRGAVLRREASVRALLSTAAAAPRYALGPFRLRPLLVLPVAPAK